MINLQTPEPLREEHQGFHDELLKAIKSGGELEKIAKQIDNHAQSTLQDRRGFCVPTSKLNGSTFSG